MANHQKIRATYESLFQKLVSTTKGNQKINNFIQGFKNTFQGGSMLPLKLSEARVSLRVSSKAPSKTKPKAKTTGSKAKAGTKKGVARKRKKDS